MKRILAKLLSFDNPIIVNIFVWTYICMFIFIVAASPIVILGVLNNPNIFEEADAAVLGTNPSIFNELSLVIKNYIEFFWIADLIELIRRKKHFKFKLLDDKTVPFLQYALAACCIYLGCILL